MIPSDLTPVGRLQGQGDSAVVRRQEDERYRVMVHQSVTGAGLPRPQTPRMRMPAAEWPDPTLLIKAGAYLRQRQAAANQDGTGVVR